MENLHIFCHQDTTLDGSAQHSEKCWQCRWIIGYVRDSKLKITSIQNLKISFCWPVKKHNIKKITCFVLRKRISIRKTCITSPYLLRSKFFLTFYSSAFSRFPCAHMLSLQQSMLLHEPLEWSVSHGSPLWPLSAHMLSLPRPSHKAWAQEHKVAPSVSLLHSEEDAAQRNQAALLAILKYWALTVFKTLTKLCIIIGSLYLGFHLFIKLFGELLSIKLICFGGFEYGFTVVDLVVDYIQKLWTSVKIYWHITEPLNLIRIHYHQVAGNAFLSRIELYRKPIFIYNLFAFYYNLESVGYRYWQYDINNLSSNWLSHILLLYRHGVLNSYLLYVHKP